MKISLRPARKSDIENYTQLLQKTYQDAYTDEKIGLRSECFSGKVFSSERIQDYLNSNLTVSDKQKTWLAFLDSSLAGSVTIADTGKECELRGFYVAPEYQGQGIGKQLWKLALNFAKNKDITIDVYAHAHKTISMYKRWGFEIDSKKGSFSRHWPEWPGNLEAKCIYMRLKAK